MVNNRRKRIFFSKAATAEGVTSIVGTRVYYLLSREEDLWNIKISPIKNEECIMPYLKFSTYLTSIVSDRYFLLKTSKSSKQ